MNNELCRNLKYCIEKASEVKHRRTFSRHYAVVTDKRGRIISEARNSYDKTHTVMKRAAERVYPNDKYHKEFCHAEALAIVRSKGRGHRIYVARVDYKGRPVNSKPCDICSFLIKEAGIEFISFTE